MRKIIVAVFVIYLVVLIKLILFKGNLFYTIVPNSNGYREETSSATYANYNLVPFKNIYNFLTSGAATATSVKLYNILGNVILFVPLGLLMPLIFLQVNRWYKVLAASAIISTLFECYQYLSHTGNLDIDDVILNSVGGLIGYGCYSVFKRITSMKR